jgi:hypothetical protein
MNIRDRTERERERESARVFARNLHSSDRFAAIWQQVCDHTIFMIEIRSL